MSSKPQVSYVTEVRSFDHAALAAYPAYSRLRQALSDLANEVSESGAEVTLASWLESVRDMTLTAPYGDMCNACSKRCSAEHKPPAGDPFGCSPECQATCRATWWPHALNREGSWITGTYACANGHVWSCGYAVDIMRWV